MPEPSTINLVEASKNNCPVICSNINVFKEVGSFINVNLNEPKVLLEKIKYLLNQDMNSRKELIENQFKSIYRHNFKIYEENFISKLNEMKPKKSLIGRILNY